MSTEEQASGGASLDAQLEKLRQYCKANDWEIVKEYVDAGVSGSTSDRPELQKLMDDSKNGVINVVLVYKLDRFSRSLRDIILMIDDLRKYGTDFVSLTEQIDTTTPVGKLMFHIIGAFAEFERDMIRQRVVMGMDKKARDGYVQYKAPFGYRYQDGKLVPEEKEAEIVRKIYEAYIREKSTLKVSRMFNMPRSLIYRILKSETYLGKVKWKDQTIAGVHEGIVEQCLYDEVQKIMRKKKKSES
ncbi:MAG: recombinase family protein [Candidatus Syntropharchaeia archaeon]